MKYITLLIIFFCATTVSADTVFNSSLISKDTILTKAKSPYVFNQQVTVTEGVTLSVESGVKLIFTHGGLFIHKGKLVGNDFLIESKENVFSAMVQCDACDVLINTLDVSGVPRSFMSVWNGASVILRNVVIDFSAAGNNITGIQAFNGSTIQIENSRFTRLTKALDIFSFSSSTIHNSFFTYNTHAIYTFNSNVDIHESDFEYNHIAVEFFASEGVLPIVDAHNNWWGEASAPPVYREDISQVKQTDINAIVGVIIYEPWSKEPHKKNPDIQSVSNVLFIPGLMGSRLYKKETFENQLWEPNRNKDVTRLFLNSSGKSIESSIYTRDIISKTNIAGGVQGIDQLIYKDFESYMNELVKSKTINSWKAIPYDWRFSSDSILNEGIMIGNGKSVSTTNLVTEVIALAKNSKTKKVTLITHSNGGLVGKQLMIELRKQKLDSLIDKIIFVAMPEYGTPQAITSLLYGHEQSIANGLILRASVAQKFGINMPSVYSLLPTEKYFDGAVVSIDGEQISSRSRLDTVLFEKGNINNNLLSRSQSVRNLLDAWVSPLYVPIYQIVGTGLLTVSGIMRNSEGDPLPQYSSSGDGTVQDMYNKSSKVFHRTGKVFIADLHGTKYKHANMMNYSPVLTYIDLLIRKNPADAAEIPFGSYPEYPNQFTLFTLSASTTELSQKIISVTHKEGKDSLTRNTQSQFDFVTQADSESRFDLFNKNIQYITDGQPQKLQIANNKDNFLDVTIYNQTAFETKEIQFEDIKLFQDAVFSFGFSNPEQYAEISMPLVNRSIQILPTVSKATTTGLIDMADKIINAKTEIYSSNVTGYIKDRYMRRLDNILKSGDKKAFVSLVESIEAGIGRIDQLSHNQSLKQKYAKLKQDYTFILYLLK